MNLIEVQSCFRCIDESMAWPAYLRLIAIEKRKDVAWLIGLPQFEQPRKNTAGDRKSQPHPRAPFKKSLAELSAHVNENRLVLVPTQMPSLWGLSDDQLIAKFTQNRNQTFAHLGTHDNLGVTGKIPMLQLRDDRWQLIRGLVMGKEIIDILENKLLTKWISEQGLTKVKRQVYAAFNCYVAGGQRKNSLLPSFDRCGAPGAKREQTKKIGRKNALCRKDSSAPEGKLILFDDHEKIEAGYGAFVRKDKTLQSAYDETMKTFYALSQIKVGGETHIELIDAQDRPTIDQFAYWGRLLTGESVTRKQTSLLDYLKSERPLPGKSTDGIPSFGHTATCDATSADTHCVSVADSTERVGVPTRICIDDMRLNYRTGFDMSYEPPSATTALRTIVHSACDKVEYCSYYGIDIAPHEWYSCLHLNFFTDNGEFNCAEVNEAGEDFHFGFDRAPTGRADLKPVESTHHSDHKKLDHKLPGTTHGRKRGRGEAHPALSARLTLHQYTTLYIRRVLFHNNKEPVPELLTSEMLKDKVEPYRGAIVRWCKDNGYAANNPYDIESMKAMLYPKMPAVLTESGIFLIAKQGGSHDQRLQRARFVSDYLIASGLMESARRNGHLRLEVRGLSTNLARIWLPTKDGLKEIRNVSDDVLLINTASLADLVQIEDKLLREKLQRRQQTDQDRINEGTRIEDTVTLATERQTSAEEALPKKQTKKEKLGRISENRAREIQLLREQNVNQAAPTETQSSSPADTPTGESMCEETIHEKSLRLYREKQRLSATNDEEQTPND